MNPTLFADLILTRYGRTRGSGPRVGAYRAAVERLRAEAERLMVAAAQAAPDRFAVDMRAYADMPFGSITSYGWLRTAFNDGSVEKTRMDRTQANEIAHAFQAGKRAAGESS